MKTFAEYLLDKPGLFTTEVREALESYQEACHNYVLDDDGAKPTPIEQMRSTPPAKDPVSVDGTCAGYGLPGANGMLSVVRVLVDVLQDEAEKAGIQRGDRVRVVKIEEVQQ